MNYTWPSRKSQHVWPTGQDFAQYAVDMRCSKCTRLLGRAIWTTLACEIKCSHCKQMNLFDISELQWNRFYNLSTVRKKQLEDEILSLIGELQ